MTESLINDPAVAKYRELEIAEGAKLVEELLKDSQEPLFIKGSLAMLRKLLQLPNRWGKSKESKEAAQNMIKRDLKTFTAKYMRLFL